MQRVNKKGKRKGRGTPLFYYLMLALPVLQFLIFYVGVNSNSILLVFKYTAGGRTDIWQTPLYANIENFFTQLFMLSEWKIPWINISIPMSNIGLAGIRSLVFCVLSIVVVMPLSLIFAYYIDKKFTGSKFFKVMLFLPGMITSMILVIIFKYFNNRALPELMKLVGMDIGMQYNTGSNNTTNVFLVLIAFYLLFAFSGSILMYLNAMSRVDKSVLEAAKIDGAGELRSFFSVMIPSIWPTIVSFITINIAAIGTFQANIFSFFQSNGSGVQTLGYYLFNIIMLKGGDPSVANGYAEAATMGIILTLVIAPITILTRFVLTKIGPRED